eukprot:1158640-Pelagomonas_calceolata.AAC.7
MQIMGSNYVNQDAFNPKSVMEESTSSTPIFFILFPGYSPSKEVEQYANQIARSAHQYGLHYITHTYTHMYVYAGRPEREERQAHAHQHGSGSRGPGRGSAGQVHQGRRLGVPGQRAPYAGVSACANACLSCVDCCAGQGWIPRLERKLEIAADAAHPDFRCFFSAEPINGAPHAKIIPESILQTCIKVRAVFSAVPFNGCQEYPRFCSADSHQIFC